MLENLEPPQSKAIRCKIADISKELDQADRAIFQQAVDNIQLWKAKTLSRELYKRGIKLADVTITRHRQQLCSCFRD